MSRTSRTSTADGPSGPPTAPQVTRGPRPASPGSVLACVCAATVLVVGFVASINLAVPQLAASSLHPSAAQLLWIVDAYVVFFACLVVPAGALGDRCGRKGVLLAGLVLFAAGALLCAVAPDVAVVLLGRGVTGVGAACVLPNALAVLVHATEPARRPAALAVWAAMSGIGGMVGNVGGGALLTTGSWRTLFAAAAPLAAACAGWVALAAPRSPRRARALDAPAVVLLTAATLALLLGIIAGPQRGWSSARVLGAFAAALVLALAWVVVELRTPHPLLDPRLLRIPALRAACLGMLVVFFGMFGFFYLNASLLQYGRGYGVLRAGLAIVPMTVPLLVGARVMPAVAARLPAPTLLGAAFLVVSVGLAGLAGAISQHYVAWAAWMLLVGAGVALSLPSLTTTITAALPQDQAGVAGGLQSMTRELGSALGVAVIGTLLTAGFTRHLGGGSGASAPHTVAAARAAQPHRHAAVVRAYTAGAHGALDVVALIVLVTGALVVGELTLAGYRARAAGGVGPGLPR